MIELENAGVAPILIRRPSTDIGALDWHGCLFTEPQDSFAGQHVLENANLKVTFTTDRIGGIFLDSFVRKGSGAHTWTNVSRDIWSANAFDTNQTYDEHLMACVLPQYQFFSTAGVVADVNGDQSLVLEWTDQVVWNTDKLNVTVTFKLAKNDDWFTAEIEGSWTAGYTRYAIDHLTLLPLRIDPYNKPNDVAAFGASTGIGCRNPIEKMKYDYDGDPASAKTGFKLKRRAVALYPSGSGIRMPVWSYYETTGREGWMVWLENHSKELVHSCFQSDGKRMLLELPVWQPGLLTAGNGTYANALGIGYKICVRPFKATTKNGWYDASYHYKTRLEATNPYFLKPVRRDDPSLDPLSKKPFLWVQVIHPDWGGSHKLLIERINKIRELVGADATTLPVFGMCAFPDITVNMFNKPSGDYRSTILEARKSGIFLGVHQPGSFMPTPWDYRKWPTTQQVWTDYDLIDSLRVSRKGQLLGGGRDYKDETASAGFYYEDSYTTLSYNPSTKKVTITPPLVHSIPSGLAGVLTAVFRHTNTDGSTTLLKGTLPGTPFSAGTTTITFAEDIVDADGNIVAPAFGDLFTVCNVASSGAASECPHAVLNSNFMDWVKKYPWAGFLEVFGQGSFYYDVETSRIYVVPSHTTVPCVGDHSSWSQINPGYVPHPQGGGSWYLEAKRDFLQQLIDYIKSRSMASRGIETVLFHSEYHDETHLDLLPVDLQGSSNMTLWRGSSTQGVPVGVDPPQYADTGYLMLPMMSVVHGGRAFTWTVNNIFSNGLLAPFNRNGTLISSTFSKTVIRCSAFWLGVDWPLGMTLPAFGQYMDQYATGEDSYDLWNEAEYEASAPGGAADPEIRQSRDYFIDLLKMELSWALDYLRNGTALPPPTVESGTTLVNAPFSEQVDPGTGPFVLSTYVNWPNLFDKDAFPAISHFAWRHYAKSWVAIFQSAWTHQNATLDITIDFGVYGFTAGQNISVFQMSPDGSPALVGTFPATTKRLATTMLPYKVGALVLVPETETQFVTPEVSNFKVLPTMVEGELHLTWDLPSPPTGAGTKFVYPRVTEVIIRRRMDAYPEDVNDGEEVYRGLGTEFTDTGLQPGQPYHYTVFCSDSAVSTTT